MNVKNATLLTFLESLPIAAVIADTTTGEILWVNGPHGTLSGMNSPERILGRSLFEFLGPEQLAIAMRDVEAVAQGASPSPVVYHVRRLDGGTADVNIASEPVLFGKRPAMVSLLFDVTESERSRSALETSEERYRSIVDGSSMAILVVVRDGVVYANGAAAHLLHAADASTLLGSRLTKHVPEKWRAALREARDTVLSDPSESIDLDMSFMRADGVSTRTLTTVSGMSWEGESAFWLSARRRRSED